MGMRLATAALKLQSDERLVKLAREAHEPAFEAIVERYRGPLERYAARMAGPCRAEDLVQHAFTRLYLFLCEDERSLVLGPWLYRVTRNAAINASRERSHEEISENYDGVPQPPQVAEQRAHLRLVMGGLAELPERQRVAMVRRELEGRSYDEVAEELGVSGVGARQLVSRARIRLRDAVGLLIPFPLLRLGDVSAAGGAGAQRRRGWRRLRRRGHHHPRRRGRRRQRRTDDRGRGGRHGGGGRLGRGCRSERRDRPAGAREGAGHALRADEAHGEPGHPPARARGGGRAGRAGGGARARACGRRHPVEEHSAEAAGRRRPPGR